MSRLASSFFALSAIPVAMWACSGDLPAGPGGSDGGSPDASGDSPTADAPVGPIPDASTQQCTLAMGNDPVALCTQKFILKNEERAAFVKALGVVASWDSKTFLQDKDDGGAPRHDFHDDVAYASSLANYDRMARIYGDSEINADIENVLVTMATDIEMELTAPPAEYGGELYGGLRNVAAQLRVLNENTHAMKLDAIADAYGRAIFAASQTLGATDSVLGTSVGGGQVAYTTADVATGALALVDMALRHDSDDPMHAALWATAAKQALDHLWTRARDPVTKLYYRALVTSADPMHDALASVDTLPSDALLTDVQATTMLVLMRANAVLAANDHDGGATSLAPLAGYTFAADADEVFRGMNAVGLWDRMDRGYLEGYLPSASAFLTNKPTRANAYMLAAIHRKFIDAPPADAGAGSTEAEQLRGLRSLIVQQTPPNASLLSVIQDQTAYLRAATKSYQLAQLPTFDGGPDGGTEPLAASYTAAATAAALEGLNELYYGH